MLRVIAPLMVLAACASGGGTAPTAPTPALNEEFVLGPGQSVAVKDTNLRLTFDRVSEDSRCPTDVTCIWEGDATVVLRIKAAADEVTREVHTQGDAPRSRKAPAGDYVVTLVRLDPAPRSTAPVEASAYRATLRVGRD
jgi:hypothetical protein